MRHDSINGLEVVATSAGTKTLTVGSIPKIQFTGTTAGQIVQLPVVSTLSLSQTPFECINDSTQDITYNSSGGNLVATVTAGQRAIFICVLLTGTSAASWAITRGGLVKFTESETLYSAKYYHKLTPLTAQANADFVAQPKGTGGFSLSQADGTAAGGNARGTYSVDLCTVRSVATQVASGSWSFNSNTYGIASGSNSTNMAWAGTASGQSAVNMGGSGVASGLYSFNSGYYGIASLYGENTHAAGRFSATGDAQRREMVLRQSSTSAGAVDLTADAAAGGTTNQVVLSNNQSITTQVLVVAKKTGTTASTAHFIVRLAATRGTAANTTVLHNHSIETLHNPDGVTLTVAADTTNGAIKFSVATPAGNWQIVANPVSVAVIYA